MKIILNDKKYSWSSYLNNSAEVYLKGIFWYEDEYYENEKGCIKIAEIFSINHDEDRIVNHIKKMSGHFAFIFNNRDYVFAMVDKIRSYPVYYHISSSKKIFVSNSAKMLQEEKRLFQKEDDAFLSFSMSGYTLGSTTLFKELYQLQPGEYILFANRSNELKKIRYYKYLQNISLTKNEGDLIENLHSATMETFDKLVKTLAGRPVFIPLSGGLDSRLILALLRQLGYKDITAYTYGIPGVWEIARAEYIAELLNIKWHFIKLDPQKTRSYFTTSDRKEYFNFASGFNSVPHLAEYYALLILREKKMIPDNAVIINGQSGDFTSGGHIPKILSNIENDCISNDVFFQTIVEKHFSLWTNLKSVNNIQKVSKIIENYLPIVIGQKITKCEFAAYFELHEWTERQSKYVVNGQRAYDWLGYDWALPLWSDALMEFWMNVDWNIKFGQKLLLKYLSHYDFGKVFNSKLPPQFSYYPLYGKILNTFFALLSKITNREKQYYTNKYLKYNMTYAPVYPQKSYREFLKDSEWHRGPASYWVKYYLEEIYESK